jgi:Vitamin K-dependent gamma-carboxylase
MSESVARVREWLLGPVDAIRLSAFRFTATIALLIYTLSWALEAREWLTPVGYHLSASASDGLQLPIPLLGPISLVVFMLVYVGSMVAISLGWQARACSLPVFAGLVYVTLADRLSSFSMNKLGVVAWSILLLAPWPRHGGAVLRSAWPLRILQATLLLQYFGAGVCKLRGGWLRNPDTLWLQAQDIYMTQLAAWMVRELPMWMWTALQHGALAFELLAPLLLCVRRLRPLGFAWGLAMHLAIGLMMYRVGLFSLSVVAYYLLFVDEQRLHAVRRWLEPERA